MQLRLSCIKTIDNLYFVINELFCNSLIMLLCIAKEALFTNCSKQILCTEVSSQLFYSLFLMLSTVNSLDKASGLPYIFVRIRTGHTPFQLAWIGYSWHPVRPVPLFFSCVTPIKPEEKAVQKVCRDLTHPYFSPSKRSRLRAKLSSTNV